MAQPKRKTVAQQRDPDADRLWVEQTGLLFESLGSYQRTGGRILALMLISDTPSMSQAEIAEKLDLSLASISPALRQLIQTGVVGKVRVPGERSDRYRLREQLFAGVLHTAVLAIEATVVQFQRGLELPGPDISSGRASLRELIDNFNSMGEVMREVLSRVQS